jgi:hypothetical protein
MELISFLGSNDEVGLLVFEKHLTVAKAINGTRLAKLEKTIGEISTITAIAYLINRFNSNFNVGRSITPQQGALIASDITEKFPHETIEDIVLMLKQVRQGIIGDGKDFKLDGQNILAKWMPEYLDKKYAEVERLNTIKPSTTNNDAVEKFYAKRRKEVARKAAEEKMHNEIDGMVKNMDRQMLEDTIYDWQMKPKLKPYLNYLKNQRLKIKS